MEPKICPECNGLCKAYTSNTNPKADEWYCEKCHRSYLMSGKDHRQTKEQGTTKE